MQSLRYIKLICFCFIALPCPIPKKCRTLSVNYMIRALIVVNEAGAATENQQNHSVQCSTTTTPCAHTISSVRTIRKSQKKTSPCSMFISCLLSNF